MLQSGSVPGSPVILVAQKTRVDLISYGLTSYRHKSRAANDFCLSKYGEVNYAIRVRMPCGKQADTTY